MLTKTETNCERCGKKLSSDPNGIHTCTPKPKTTFRCVIILLLTLWDTGAMAADTEYQKGFKDGWTLAAQLVMQNRDHYRALIGLPEETHAQAIERIYARTGKQTSGNVIDQCKSTMADGVDLYVVLPPEITPAPPPHQEKQKTSTGYRSFPEKTCLDGKVEWQARKDGTCWVVDKP